MDEGEAAADVEVLVAVVAEMPEGVTLVVEICVLITVEPSAVTIGGEVVEVVIERVTEGRVSMELVSRANEDEADRSRLFSTDGTRLQQSLSIHHQALPSLRFG